MEISRHSTPQEPTRDLLLTGTLLHDVAARTRPATVRVFRPGPTLAFGRRDSFAVGFERAREGAQRRGFAPMIRHAGGHAVAYEQNSIIVEWVRPEDRVLGGTEERFEALTTLIQDSLEQLGVSVEVGELPNEYCAGRFSLHLFEGPKVVGVAQRVIKGASLTTAVVAVGAGERLRAVTTQVYRDLNLPLDESTIGAITDQFSEVDGGVVGDVIADRAMTHLSG